MSNSILEPKLKSVEELLSGDSRFSVPKYQRSFAWEEDDEVKELWEDIEEAVKNRREDYFMGTIVLQSSRPGLYEIIDGQQRLTCISMIFSAIRNVFKARGDERAGDVFLRFLGSKDFSSHALPKPKLELNHINDPTYLQYIIESADYDAVTKALQDKGVHESNRKLLQAYRFFLDKIGEEAKRKGTQLEEFMVPLIDCLRSSIKLITIPVTNEEGAYLIFESLNARGKELAVSDLVKNRLYHEVGNANVQQAQQLWQQMEVELVRRSIPEFLRHYWIAKKADEKNLSVREKQLYKLVVKDATTPRKTMNLLTDLRDSANDYARITDYDLWPDDSEYDTSFEQSLNELKLFRVSQCYPVLLNAIQVFKTPQKIAKTFRFIANFSFRYNIIGNGTSGSLERIFGEIACGIRTGTHTSPSDVADALRSSNPDTKFRADFELASVTKPKLARYILAKLNNQMEGKEKIANPDAKAVNLEHILPEHPSSEWESAFSTGVNPSEYICRLGNLTLLTAKPNREAGNLPFKDKVQIVYSQSTLPLNTLLSRVTKWNEVEIDNRQKALAKMALQVWKL